MLNTNLARSEEKALVTGECMLSVCASAPPQAPADQWVSLRSVTSAFDIAHLPKRGSGQGGGREREGL